MSLNAHYMVLFKNPGDVSQFANLARQMYPKTSLFAVEAYRRAMREPYSYLLVDLRPDQDEEFRLRTNIFPERLTMFKFQNNKRGYKRERIRRQVQCTSRYRTEMSRRVKMFLPVLRRIRKMGDKARRDYVKKCNREFIDCVSEYAKDVIKGNVQMSGPQKANLRRRRKDARALAIKKTSLTKKRSILQKGGFLTALLPPVLSILSSMFRK